MANRSYQTITLYGNPEKVEEVIKFIKGTAKESLGDGTFFCETFPISLCGIEQPNKIHLETKYASVGFYQLSRKFPEVEFMSSSTTEGLGEELTYIINGQLLYSVYYNYEYMECQEPAPTVHLNKENIKKAFNIKGKEAASN
jgi:hypothetical protein